MPYAIRHVTRYRYTEPIVESHMEVRMQPRSEGYQRCWDFRLRTSPRAKIGTSRDSLGNAVHFFDVPGRHARLTITAEARVEFNAPPEIPDRLDGGAWAEIDALAREFDHWEMLVPSQFARPTPLLEALRDEMDLARRDDPLTTLIGLNHHLYDHFAYVPRSTRVDSPIDEALEARQGVCQDFSHIMIALVRGLGIPCRYVSGYLYHGDGTTDRSARLPRTPGSRQLLPGLGWNRLRPNERPDRRRASHPSRHRPRLRRRPPHPRRLHRRRQGGDLRGREGRALAGPDAGGCAFERLAGPRPGRAGQLAGCLAGPATAVAVPSIFTLPA